MSENFYEWLVTLREDSSPVGDLANDICRDQCFPKQLTSLSELTCHLQLHGACLQAVKAAREAWKIWRKRGD